MKYLLSGEHISKLKNQKSLFRKNFRYECGGSWTSFDVESRYSGTSSSVILVEGSVKVHADGRTKVIYPDEQISLQRDTKEINSEEC